MKEKIKVKFLHRGNLATEDSNWKLQTPNNSGELGICSFTFNPLEKKYDWLVIIDDIPRIIPNRTEILNCPKENTILVTTEPNTIAYYGEAFANQFNYLITNQSKKYLPHKNAQRSQTGNVWMYGKDYKTLINENSIKKTKKISTICSNKQQGHTIHKLRYDITLEFEKSIKELERFGRGFKWIDNKCEAIDDYEFHIVIENQNSKNVWTEKLADAFLGYTVPIYFGCTNVYDYFPKDSIILIDIYNKEESIKKIKEIISKEGEYQRRFEAVKEARRRVIEEYNLLAMVNKIVENSPKHEFTPNIKIASRRIMRAKNIKDLFKFIKFKLTNFVKEYI